MNRRLIGAIVFLGVLLPGFLAFYWLKNIPKSVDPIVGRVVFLKQIPVTASGDGMIAKWAFTQYAIVQKGQVLAVLAETNRYSSLQKAEKNLQIEEKRFAENKALLIKEYNKVQAQYIKVKTHYQDIEGLADAIATKESLRVKKELNMLEAEKTYYQDKLAKYDRESSVCMEIETLKKQVNTLKQMHPQPAVISPISGLLLDVLVPTGSIVRQGQPIARIGRFSDLRVVVFVSKTVKVGQRVHLNFRSTQALGRVERIDPPVQFKNQIQYVPVYIAVLAPPIDVMQFSLESDCLVNFDL